ncbi:MAG TPA: response regulator transcription factor, partial [Candidatus Alistipes intestinipullorum]|nr:response regulator transcription factor [Candidatus Alistipes intestinipullorum]
LTKPIKMKLLVSRVQAILKRIDADQTPSGTAASGITIDRERYRATIDGKPLALPRKEFELLALLCASPGRLITREEIYAQIWGSEVVVGDRTIDVHIRKLRQKIGEERIVTVKGVGYKYEP